MTSPQPFTVSIAPDLPADDRDALVLALRDHVDVQESTPRSIDPEQARIVWETLVAFMKDAGVVAGGATAMIALAQKIIAWRKELQQRGVEPKARLEHANQEPLDLATAPDAQVQAWLLQAQPER